jgi:hypothetical protein
VSARYQPAGVAELEALRGNLEKREKARASALAVLAGAARHHWPHHYARQRCLAILGAAVREAHQTAQPGS